jgi:nitrate reductase gamma subunit
MAYQLNKEKMQNKSGRKSILSSGKLMITAMIMAFVSFVSFDTQAATGEDLWENCMACHATSDKVLTGPGLKGITERRSEEWLFKWIRNSQELIASGDQDAIDLFEEYNKVPMQAFPDLSDDDLKALLTYIEEEGAKAPDTASGGAATTGGNDEAAGKPLNTTMLGWGVLIVVVVGFFAYRYSRKTKEEVAHMGFHPSAHKVKNYPGAFLIYACVAGAIIYILTALLTDNAGMINELMFTIFPYVAFAIFLVGTIYRYTKKGFKVTSLSSQFIEGKQLFWGSQPFHWGIMILFFGHLIAFLFPSALTAWNGMPVRRLILELSSFAFGLAALLGLVLLIIRRLRNKSLLVVTNKMDMVVYVVLLTQIISGLGVAFYVRWGSEWFASVLTPYLRSVFSFNPDITAVATMPLWIQIHIISAFFIIAIIPFTRFMHFLVAPVDYIWRKYQIVIWNWNRKAIRNSTQHTFGKKSKNH